MNCEEDYGFIDGGTGSVSGDDDEAEDLIEGLPWVVGGPIDPSEGFGEVISPGDFSIGGGQSDGGYGIKESRIGKAHPTCRFTTKRSFAPPST